MEFFATHLAHLRSENPNTIVVSAGDNIGASSLLSGMFHGEPTAEALSDAMTGIVEGYRPFFSTLGDRDVGSITAPLLRAPVAPGPQDRFIRRP